MCPGNDETEPLRAFCLCIFRPKKTHLARADKPAEVEIVARNKLS